jgi:predicted MPP superfamily phosphohydrolase
MSDRKWMKWAAGLGAVGAACLIYGYTIEGTWLEVNPVDLTLPRLEPEFDGYRIAQVSDLHLNRWTSRDYLDEIAERVNAAAPDLIALTGDFVTRHAERYGHLLADFLRSLRARDACVGVLGNHDQYANPELIRQTLREYGVVDLNNEVYTIRRRDASLHIAGLGDVKEKIPRLDVVLTQLPPKGAAILLSHEPDFADAAVETGRFDLQLSGHSHGGQVRLPLLGPLPPILPKLGRKYVSGRYPLGDMQLYTNRGVGMVQFPIRFNCRPEITRFILRANG